MIKVELDLFSSHKNWEKKRNITFFENKKKLDFYQKYYLNKLINNNKKYIPITLKSSGTTNNKPKDIKFPNIFYKNIENHHIWKIMKSHHIKSGNAIKIFQGSYNNSSKSFLGPFKIPSMGIENNSWELIYNPIESNENFWQSVFKFIEKINPCFLYTSPSVFISMLDYLENKNIFFNFPVIFSCETLTDSVREKSKRIFLKTIDKMLDWTTGLGFFECPFNTKHVYDEFCIIRQEGNAVYLRSLFNYLNTEEKVSDDFIMCEEIKCNCGIYGNFLKNFQGKIFECLVSIKGKKYSANYISNILSTLPFELNQYEIIQDKEKNIEFNTKNRLSDFEVMQVSTLLNRTIGDGENFFTIFNNNKLLLLSYNSNLCVHFFEKSPKIYKCKTVSVRSYV